ncbi:biotin transporter BioY [Celeribacter naphthalenivorans]|uniref:biotin transporter BioY n=1 Tax=Celeribacter naphthalenivorans TaxID=1614694 RepID=UPI001CFC2B94|nr:biotin transporter BioY [Celeribacter naphthalenivorans]
MTATPTTQTRTPDRFSPLDLQSRSLPIKLAAIFLGSLFLATSSYIEVPMIPVPVTLQTYAIMLVGALYGWKLGGLTVLTWLIEGAAGLPVLAGGASGVQHFLGATGGYLFAFPISAMLVGWLAERGWNGHRPFRAFAAMLLGTVLCLSLGAAWLSTLIGVQKAVTAGVLPFLIGAVLKSAFGAATLRLMQATR